MDQYPYRFQAPIDRYDFGTYHYTVVYLPWEITDRLPMDEYPRLRVRAEIDHVPVEGALMPDRLGSPQTRHLDYDPGRAGERIWYLMVSRKVMSRLGKAIGDDVSVRFGVADQNAVEIPDALQEMLDDNPRLREIWDTLSAGKRRGLVHPIATARTAPTLHKRLTALEATLLDL